MRRQRSFAVSHSAGPDPPDTKSKQTRQNNRSADQRSFRRQFTENQPDPERRKNRVEQEEHRHFRSRDIFRTNRNQA
jgi:hypothetical protein